MYTFNDFCKRLSEQDLREIIDNYEQFQKDGYIGKCLLRSNVEEWERIIGTDSYTIMFFRDFAMYAYQYFAYRYFDLVK